MFCAQSSRQNLHFGPQSSCRCFYEQAFWLCVVHTLNKRFLEKVMFLVCTAQSFKRRISFVFLPSSNMQEILHASILAVCGPYTGHALSQESNVSNCLHSAKFPRCTTESTLWPSPDMQVLSHAGIMAVRGPYTEPALS